MFDVNAVVHTIAYVANTGLITESQVFVHVMRLV